MSAQERARLRKTKIAKQTRCGKPLPEGKIFKFFIEQGEKIGCVTKITAGHLIAGVEPKKAHEILKSPMEWANRNGVDVRGRRIVHGQIYKENDWAGAEPQGESYRRGLDNCGGTGLVGRVFDYRRTDASHLEDDFQKHAPGVLSPAGREARVNAIAESLRHPTITGPRGRGKGS